CGFSRTRDALIPDAILISDPRTSSPVSSDEPVHDASTAASPAVDDAISHLATLTAQRDRELLDVSLAQSVLDLLGVSAVGVYRLLGREDEVQHWLGCGLARRGAIAVSDPPWVNIETLPRADAYPRRQSVLASRLPEQSESSEQGSGPDDPRFVTVFPLYAEVGMPGVLEVWS